MPSVLPPQIASFPFAALYQSIRPRLLPYEAKGNPITSTHTSGTMMREWLTRPVDSPQAQLHRTPRKHRSAEARVTANKRQRQRQYQKGEKSLRNNSRERIPGRRHHGYRHRYSATLSPLNLWKVALRAWIRAPNLRIGLLPAQVVHL